MAAFAQRLLLTILVCPGLHLLPLQVHANEADDSPGVVELEYPISNPVSLGIGWNFVDNRRTLQTCIEFEQRDLDFQDRSAQLTVVEDHESLSTALNVSVTARYQAVLSNFSASASFVQSTNFEARAIHVAVMADVREGPEFVVPIGFDGDAAVTTNVVGSVRLRPEFADLAQNDLDEFNRQCGQGFVAVVQSGARINAVLTFFDTNRAEREEISVALSGGGGGASFSASFQNMMESFSRAQRFSVSYLGLGGASPTIPLDREGLMAAVRDLPAVSSAAPRPFTMLVQRYDELPNWPQVIIPSELSSAERLAEVYWRLFTIRSYVRDALFEDDWLLILDADRESLVSLDDELETEMLTVRDALWLCVSEGECDVSAWEDWNDYVYRSQLPFKGSWLDIQLDPSNTDFDYILGRLAEARLEQWVVPAWQSRCDRGVCVSASRIEEMRSAMFERMQGALD